MSKKTLNQTNLAALGADQLAALLIEISAGSADIKRRLRLELSHNLGASELAHEVRKRLASLRKSTSFIGWRKRKGLIKDLSTQVMMITDKIAPEDPTTAFDLLWDFIAIAPFIYGRTDDSKGDVGNVFRGALDHFETLGPRAVVDTRELADRVWTALQDNGYGEWDGIIALMAPVLEDTGLARLTSHVQAYADAPPEDDEQAHEAIRFLRKLRGGDAYAAAHKARFVRQCMQDIAAATGDTHAYIAQYTAQDLRRRDIAASVAMLLLEVRDAAGALDHLLGADTDGTTAAQDAWDTAYIATLLALDRQQDAQTHRLTRFQATLHPHFLRDYLKLLPDFEDVDAEDAAMRHAAGFPQMSAALRFFTQWPDLVAAARCIMDRMDDINGAHTAILVPAAEALRTRHPLAAVILWRAMIDAALGQNQAARYSHAAECLTDCASVDGDISDYGSLLSHDAYLDMLRTQHGHKASFWKKVH